MLRRLPKKTLYVIVLLLSLLLAMPAYAQSGSTITVNTMQDELNNNGNCSLREAIESVNRRTAVDNCAAPSGGSTIVVPAGTIQLSMSGAGEDANQSGDLDLMANIMIRGAGSDKTFLDGAGADRLFHVMSNVSASIDGMTLRNGAVTTTSPADGGGAILNLGMLAVANVMITNNSVQGTGASGGGIHNEMGRLTITNSSINNNASVRAGGGVETNVGTVMLRNVVFNGNSTASTPGNGGALHVTGAGNVTAINGVVINNTASAEGGGFWNGSGNMTITGTVFEGNVASGVDGSQGGGALFNIGGTLNVNNARILNNSADGESNSSGGALLADGGSVTIRSTMFSGNSATRAGGAIELDARNSAATLTVNDSTFNGNTTGAAPGNGGAIHISGAGNATITNGAVSGNSASAEGGGFWNGSGTMTINGTFFEKNIAGGVDGSQGGGALFNIGGTLNINSATIRNNEANGETNSSGGGLLVDGGAVTIRGTTFEGNSATRAGGGIELDARNSDATLTVESSNFINNSTGSAPGNGGAIHISGAGNADITGGIVRGNMATAEGGGFWNGSGTMNVSNITFDGNSANGVDGSQGGGALFNIGGTLNVTNAIVRNNTAAGENNSSGGGLLVDGGSVTIRGTTFVNNSATRAGGAIELDARNNPATLNVSATNFLNNSTGSAPGNGGAIHVSGAGNSDISGGLVRGNTAAAEGGGFWNGSGTMTINGTAFQENVASGIDGSQGGGALFNIGGTLNLSGVTVRDNMADGEAMSSGGGIMVDGGMLMIRNSSFVGNSATRAGGAIELDARNNPATLDIADSFFTANSTGAAPGNGGAIHISGAGDADISGGTVTNNTASREGGGFWNGGGTMSVDGTLFANNTAAGAGADDGGGALFNQGGTLNVNNAKLIDNSATGAKGSGGGIFNNGGILNVSESTISNNNANRAGGGIEDNAGESALLTNVRLMGNDAGKAPGNGGGLHISGAGNVTVLNSFVLNNTAVEGGGLWNSAAGTLVVRESVVYGNRSTGTAADDNGGGGIYNDGMLTVGNSTISSNMAAAHGGGVFNTASGSASIANAIIFENGRSGIENLSDTSVMLADSVVAHAAVVGTDCIGAVSISGVILDADGSCGGRDVRNGECEMPAFGPWPPCVFNKMQNEKGFSISQ